MIFKGFGMPKWRDCLNHLACADDIIIFVNADRVTLYLIMDILRKYEEQSGQKINKDKRLFFMFNKAARTVGQEVELITFFHRGKFLLMYLGCPTVHEKNEEASLCRSYEEGLESITFMEGQIIIF